jgi:hypothetical protein
LDAPSGHHTIGFLNMKFTVRATEDARKNQTAAADISLQVHAAIP